MPRDATDLDRLYDQLAAHRSTLAILLRQLGQQTPAHARPELFHGISFARGEIARLKQALHSYGETVEDAPGDEETTVEREATAQQPAGGAQIANAEVAGMVDLRGANFTGARGVQITGVQVGRSAKKPETDDPA